MTTPAVLALAAAAIAAAATFIAFVYRGFVTRWLTPAVKVGAFAYPVTSRATLTPTRDGIRVVYSIAPVKGTFRPVLFVTARDTPTPGLAALLAANGHPVPDGGLRRDLTLNEHPIPFDTPLMLKGKQFTISYLIPAVDGRATVWVDTPLVGTRPTVLTVGARGLPDSIHVAVGQGAEFPRMEAAAPGNHSEVTADESAWPAARVTYTLT